VPEQPEGLTADGLRLAGELAVNQVVLGWLEDRRREVRDTVLKLGREAQKLPSAEYVAVLEAHDTFVRRVRASIFEEDKEEA
jgi:hypothetical protein